MLGKVEALVQKARKAAEILAVFSGEIRVVSHHDCDGICSGAIMAKALLREGRRFRLSFVRQLTGDVIDALAKEGNRLTLFLDMGSGQLDAIQSKLMKSGEVVLILDHHQQQGELLSERLLQINAHCMGMGENISGSGIAYLLARAMNPENKDLSEIGVVGAIGDSQIDSIGPDWGLFGLNREIVKDAVSSGKMSVERGLRIWGKCTRPIHKALEFSMDPYIPGVSGSESGAVHFLQELGIPLKPDAQGRGAAEAPASGLAGIPASGRCGRQAEWRTLSDLSEEEIRKLASGIIRERLRGNHDNPDWVFGDVYTLPGKGDYGDASEFATVLNAAGKQAMGYLGVELCFNSPAAFGEVPGVLECYRRDIGRALDIVCNNGGRIENRTTGSASYILAGSAISEHVISNVTSILSRSGRVPDKPVFSFVDSENGMTKISARLPDSMAGALNLKDAVSEAAKSAGGEGGGHSNAAGASIPRGAEQMFINSMETILTNLKSKETGHGGRGEGGRGEGGACGPGTRGRPEEGTAQGKAGRPLEGQGLVRYIGA